MVGAYGSWSSPLSAAALSQSTIRLSELRLDGADTYWIESRPLDGGRSILVRQHNGATYDLTSAPDGGTFDARTRVHEYGGASYAVEDGVVVISRREDDRLYRVDASGSEFGAAHPLVPADGRRYADPELDVAREVVYAIAEDHGELGGYRTDPVTQLVAIPLDGSAASDPNQILTLASGSDFYSSPRLSADGVFLVWITWEHPDMPWDAGQLHLAAVADGGSRLVHERVIAGGSDISVAEPLWMPSGDLIHVDDRSGWWNFYRTEFDGPARRTRDLHPSDAEFTLPAWGLGPRTADVLDARHLIVSFSSAGRRRLGAMDTINGSLELWPGEWQPESDLRAAAGRVVMIASTATQPTSIVELDLARGQVQVLRSSASVALDADSISVAKGISWPSDAGVAHGFVYLPITDDEPRDELPPLLVLSHGGPTSATSAGFDPAIQFWTTRGFAVLDVNYSGSTGYGRHYRNRLRGAWGVADVADCASGAQRLADQGIIDGARMAVRGGSAGGYTTLAALTFTNTFAAGASYYGIGDLAALAAHTHKFESRYLDSLIGPYPQAEATYRQRSPIHHTHRLSAPMILLQGRDDRVVPPEQAETMAAAVRAAGLDVEVVMFEGEGHGFRRAETKRAALEAELDFYGRVFGFAPS